MSEKDKHQRNQNKISSQESKIPFRRQLQQRSSDAINQAFQPLKEQIKTFIKKIEDLRQSKVIVYYSIGLLDSEDFENIFELVSSLGRQKKLDLYILSSGGFAHPAYKIARLFQDYSEESFSVLIPYYAKSAVTILSLGADEIIMGPASELGPIDPQFRATENSPAISALTLKESLEYITKAIKEDPKIAPLYAPLLDKVNLIELGHFEREIESAKQYGEVLLTLRKKNKLLEKDAKKIANQFVQQYKTHNFVIDGQVAFSLLNNTVKILEINNPIWQNIWLLHNIYNQYMKDKKIIKIMETLDESYEVRNKKINLK